MFGPVAMAYNIEGVDKLVVNADVLAKIFQGQITKWNDPAIAALNSGTTLPDADIKPVYRSDSSGTTDNFQTYLAAAAPQSWTKGAGKEFQGGAGEGAQKSSGVVQAIQATPGSIGYVEKSPAAAAGLKNAEIDSGAGAVALTDDSTKAAVAAAKFKAEGMDLTLDLNALYAQQGSRLLPVDAGDLRDRVQQGLRRRYGRRGEVVPDGLGEPGPGQPVGRRLRPAAGLLQGASAQVRRRNCIVGLRASTIAVRMGAGTNDR